MYVAIAAGLVGLVVVLIAYYRDPPVEQRRLEPPGHWDVLPDPGEIARAEFPLSFPGYDPATVEFHFELVTRAYADLLAAASPEMMAKARRSAALRRGVDVDTLPPRVPAGPGEPLATALQAPLSSEGANAEALRAEAALADLDAQRPPA